MTFEATDTRAPETLAEETAKPAWRLRRAPEPRPLASQMLDFVNEAGNVGGRLEGLALMFRSTFLPDHGESPANWEEAAEIVADLMDTMAQNLELITMNANAVHHHETRGGAR